MLLGITGTDGAGKGEKVWETFARGCQEFLDFKKRNSDNLNSACKQVFSSCVRILLASNQILTGKSKTPAPGTPKITHVSFPVCF